MHRRSSNLARGVILVPKLSKCEFRSSNLLIVSHEVQIIIFKLQSGSVQLMWSLHAGANFILNFSAQHLYFSNFFQNIVSKCYAKYFLFQYFLQNFSFLFSISFTNLII
jgi:hypothetical protein